MKSERASLAPKGLSTTRWRGNGCVSASSTFAKCRVKTGPTDAVFGLILLVVRAGGQHCIRWATARRISLRRGAKPLTDIAGV